MISITFYCIQNTSSIIVKLDVYSHLKWSQVSIWLELVAAGCALLPPPLASFAIHVRSSNPKLTSQPLGWITATAYQVLVRHGKADWRYSQFSVLNKSETHALITWKWKCLNEVWREKGLDREREMAKTIE